MKIDYDLKGLLYAEIYGILEYKVVGNTLKYSKTSNENTITKYDITVNLDSLKEIGSVKHETI